MHISIWETKKLHIFTVLFLSLTAISANASEAVKTMHSSFENAYSIFGRPVMPPYNLQHCCGNNVSFVNWGSKAKEGSKVIKFEWWEDNYDGKRSGRGIEATSSDEIRIKKEGWYGLSFWINTAGEDSFNLNTSTCIAQGLAHGPDSCPITWTWILNTEPNGLILTHRIGGGKQKTYATLLETIPTGQWVDVIFHMVYSNKGTGQMEVWVGKDCLGTKGKPSYSAYDIRMGCDCWDGDSLETGTHMKFGMYCHDVKDYIDGEKRTIYFDQVSVIDGNPADAWYKVNPNPDLDTTVPAAPSSLDAKAGDGCTSLDWADSNEADLAGYNVYRSTTSCSGYTSIASGLSSSNYLDKTVTDGTTYYYAVTAVDTSWNESVNSAEASAISSAQENTDKCFVEISTLEQLAEYAAMDNVKVKMQPGVYDMNSNSLGGTKDYIQHRPGEDKPRTIEQAWLLNFSGSNNRFDLTGVTIKIDTKLNSSFGRKDVHEVIIDGSNNIIDGLAIKDYGNQPPRKAAVTLHLQGDNNTIKNLSLFVEGSKPYGYGCLLGKGRSPLVPLAKHSSFLITGKDNKIFGARVISRSFGHGIFMQGAVNTYLQDCYVEGEIRSTDEILKETSGPAHSVNFQSIDGGKIQPGRMISLSEDGIRAYPWGGVKYRRTEKITVVNCTVKNMRSGCALGAAIGPVVIKGSTAIGCYEKGFSMPSESIIEDSKGDAAYGPLLCIYHKDSKNVKADVQLINTSSDFHSEAIAYINGSCHDITIRPYEGKKLAKQIPIIFSSTNMMHIRSFGADGVKLFNSTSMPIEIRKDTINCKIVTNGPINLNQGRNNEISKFKDETL